MEAGTFTIVDEGVFYPIVKLQENQQKPNEVSDGTDQSDDESESSDTLQNKEEDHRKVVRRKSVDSTSNSESESNDDDEINEEKTKDNEAVKLEDGTPNAFEFCGTVDDGVEVKDEALSAEELDGEQKDSIISKPDEDDSDDDIPLAALDKYKLEKRSCDDSDSEKKKVKKLKFTKVDNGLKVEYNIDVHYCAKCKKFCKNGKKYRSHIRKVHGKLYKCKICTRSYDNQDSLDDHYNSHTGNRPYSCYLCENESFKTEQALKRHMKKIHSDKPKEKKHFECHLCRKILATSSSLEDHLRLHSGEKPLTCNICDKSFARERDLKQHLNLHDESWKCKFCHKCFLTPYKLKEHIRKHTGELPYECDKCDRRFSRAGDFRYHVGTHLGLKPYNCEECGMRFTTSSNVTRHRLNTHQEGPRLLSCPHCGKLFHTASRLNAHVKNHENKKRFKCELCPVTRSSLAELNKHAMIHGGEYRCDTCHRGFASAERLASHASRHDIAGKPYACFVCSIGYRSSQSLNKHLATVHKNEDIPRIAPQHLCTLCGQVFEMKDKLNRHLKENHIVIVVGEIHSLDEDIDSKVPFEADNKSELKVNASENIVTVNKSEDIIKPIVEDKIIEPMVLQPLTKTIESTEINTVNITPDKVLHDISKDSPDNSVAKDLSASSLDPELKTKINQQNKMPHKPFEDNIYPRNHPYNEMIVQQSNRLLPTNYRPHFENYPQEQMNNGWFLPKSNDTHHQSYPKGIFDPRQRYNDLRMPVNQIDYRNFNHVKPDPIPRQKYYYDQNPNINYQNQIQNPHYHAFSSPHLFQNFRDLRMLGTDYGHARHLPQLTGMDMTNQRLNPTSPISPYSQSPHVMDNMSPMSRNSYEDISHAAHGYHQGGHTRSNVRNNTDPNNKDDPMNNAGPYEMKVAAN